VAAWIILAVIGLASSRAATSALSTRFSVPGGKGIAANGAIMRRFGTGGTAAPVVPVLMLPRGVTVHSPGVRAELRMAFSRVAAAVPGSRVASYASTGDTAFVSHDGRTTFGLVYPPATMTMYDPQKPIARIRAALHGVTIAGSRFDVTGLDALSTGTGNNGGNGVMGMTAIAGLTALIVLIFVFGSALAILPLLMALVAIPTTFLVVWGLASVTYVSFIIEFLIALVGLGVAIDYSLLVVMRWREERAGGSTNEQAVLRAMETAGRSVVYSGCTVAIGLFALIVLPLPFLRSMGYGGILIPLVTVAVVLTLLPVVLATAGPKLDWPRRAQGRPSRLWTAWAGQVVKHPWIGAVVGLLLLGGLLSAGRTISLGTARSDSLARMGEAHSGLAALERSGIGSGVLMPFELLVSGTSPFVVAGRVGSVSGVRGAVAPASWERGGAAVVDALPAVDGSSSAAGDVLARLRAVAIGMPGSVQIGGGIAGNADFTNAIYGNFPEMIALILVLTFLFLARAFRSVLLPLKAVLLNLASVVSAWGVIVLVWQDGIGSRLLWGVSGTGEVDSWIPIIVFCFLFGLSMDYEVFLLSRVREAYDATGSTEQAVVTGIGRIGRLITGAALILFLAFVSMTSGPQTQVKMLGTGLAAGILLDATVVRMLLVPSLVVLFGRWNWWLPNFLVGLVGAGGPSGQPTPADRELVPDELSA
jgi:RND superfamily putative drug exporter